MKNASVHWQMRFHSQWQLTDKIPGSFTKTSGFHLFEHALECPNLMVEVGVDQGRSASLLLAAAYVTGARVILIDSWESLLVDNLQKVRHLISKFPDVSVTIIHETSERAAALWMDGEADLIHIDANHYDDNPDKDCKLWLPKLKSGGIAAFHDYRSSFPALTDAVDRYTEEWISLGDYDSLAIRRKP